MKKLRRALKGWTLKRILLSIAMVSLLASTAMAANVTLSGAVNGTYTLTNMTINSNGDITLNVSGGNPPPPGSVSLSLSPATLPAGTVNSVYNNTVTMTASEGTAPYSYSCSGSGVAGLSASNNGSTCTISGTPTATGVYIVNFSVTDSATTPSTASNSISFSVASVPEPGGNCINIGPQYPSVLDNQSIPPKSIVNYCFTIDKTVTSIVPYIRSRDWKTSSHMFVSNVSNPTMSDISTILASGLTIHRDGSPPWYSFGSYSNERLVLSRSAKAGDKYYVTVYNSESVSSLIQLYWQAF